MTINERLAEIQRAMFEARQWLNAVEALVKGFVADEKPTLEILARAYAAANPATRESERSSLVAEVGDCCGGGDPFCSGGCLVEVAVKRRAVATAEGQS